MDDNFSGEFFSDETVLIKVFILKSIFLSKFDVLLGVLFLFFLSYGFLSTIVL